MKSFKISFLLIFFSFFANQFAQTNTMINFYPLHVGDVWQYKITYRPASYQDKTYYLFKKVIADTILANGKRYFLIEQPPFTYDEIKNSERVFIRIDSTNGLVYKYISNDKPEKIIDSLFCKTGDRLSGQQFSCGGIENQFVLSERRNTLSRISFTTTNWIDFRWDLALDIGIYHQSMTIAIVAITGNSYDLVYAKINGKEYGTLVGVRDEEKMPTSFSLSQNYPNPFNPTTTIKYSVPFVETQHAASQLVTLKVFDLLGKEVATLVNEEKSAGNYEVKFNSETLHATSLPSGVYFYTIKAGNFIETKKMILMK